MSNPSVSDLLQQNDLGVPAPAVEHTMFMKAERQTQFTTTGVGGGFTYAVGFNSVYPFRLIPTRRSAIPCEHSAYR